MVAAMHRELEKRMDELPENKVATIYFGGGTPSLLSGEEVSGLIARIHELFDVEDGAEVTLEANPDDLSPSRYLEFREAGINRLSIGIQSFREEDLKLMNRAHDAAEARACLQLATHYFNNISLDLIYGIPGLTREAWIENIEMAVASGVQHISSYALTVEPRTALKAFIEKGLVPEPSDEEAEAHFRLLTGLLEAAGFIHYELSNFGRPGFFSRNNSAYWQGKPYLGIGPSAHSFDGKSRSWNVASNPKYLKALDQGELPITRETLTLTDRYNEYVMTGLRTLWGISRTAVREQFGDRYSEHLVQCSEPLIRQGLLEADGDLLHVSRSGKFLSDGIASELFMVNFNSSN